MNGANDIELENESSRSLRPLIWNRLTCPADSVDPGREGPSLDAQPRTMWCGWKARNVMSDCFVLSRPAEREWRRRRSAREPAVVEKEASECGRTGVAELAERLGQVVHVPQLDDVVGRAPARPRECQPGLERRREARGRDARRKDGRVLVHRHLRQPALVRLQRLDRLREANVPQAHLAAQAASCTEPCQPRPSKRGREQAGDALCRRELAVPPTLHVHVLHPRVVHARVPPHHVVPLRQAAVVHAQAAVAESTDDDVARDLVACERGEARVGARGEVLRGPFWASAPRGEGGREEDGRGPHLDRELTRRVPHADVLDVAAHEELPATLLPLDDEPRVGLARAPRQLLRDALERRDELDVVGRLVRPEEADIAVGCGPFERSARSH